MEQFSSLVSTLNILFIIAAMIGGYMALRAGRNQQASLIQDQAINALKAELEAVQRRIEVLERENTRLHMTINLVKKAIKQRGFNVTIDGDMVTIEDRHGGSSTISRLEGNEK